MDDTLKSSSGRMSPEPSAATKERTSEPSSKSCAASKTPPYLFLDLRHGGGESDGPIAERSWQTSFPLRGESWTPEVGEFPKDAVESSLSSILMDNPPEKYRLSARACVGILRRSEKRGKPLPPLLKEVLERQAGLSPTPSKSEADVLGGEGSFNSGGPVCNPGNEQRSIPVPTTVSSPGIRVQSGSVREGPGHRVGGGDIPDSGSQYVGDRTDSVLPDAFAIENHPQDCRVKLSEDGTVQTLAARMGTGGGGTRLLSSSPVPAGAVRELCPGRSERHSGDTQDLPDPEHRGPTFTYRRQKFGVFLKDQTTGTLRTMEGRDPSMVILETEGGI